VLRRPIETTQDIQNIGEDSTPSSLIQKYLFERDGAVPDEELCSTRVRISKKKAEP
jgi:hypothetical protein